MKINNVGIGALYATFYIERKVNPLNIGDAVTLTHDNEIGHGKNGDQLLGRLAHVELDMGVATVQIGGITRFRVGDYPAGLNESVVVDGRGAVHAPYQDCTGRGITLAIYDDSYCDVYL